MTPAGLRPHPAKEQAPLETPLRSPLGEGGKGEPCPLRVSVGLWSRVKVKPLRGRASARTLTLQKQQKKEPSDSLSPFLVAIRKPRPFQDCKP